MNALRYFKVYAKIYDFYEKKNINFYAKFLKILKKSILLILNF